MTSELNAVGALTFVFLFLSIFPKLIVTCSLSVTYVREDSDSIV